MKKKKSPVKVVVPLILAVAAAGVGYKVVNRYIPSKEVMDGNEYFGTSEGRMQQSYFRTVWNRGKHL